MLVAVAIPGVLDGGTYPNRWVPQAGRYGWGSPVPTIEPAAHVVQPVKPDGDRGSASYIRPMIPLGQFRDTFIIAIDDEGVAIIDQHVAHERVLFEQVMEKLTSGRLPSQRLLTPLLIELSQAQRQALVPHAATLERFGR